MRFLIDRCAGRRLADWLRSNGHDVVEARELGPDPGDRVLLDHAARATRILVTIDTDFGKLIHLHNVPHTGLVRLPDVPGPRRIALIDGLIQHHEEALEAGTVVTIRGERIRISRLPPGADSAGP